MNYLKTSILSLCMSLSISAFALDVTSVAGNLRGAVGDNLSTASLKITGSVNAADFEFINYELKNLRTLDLSAASIAEYNGDRLLSGAISSAANVLPNYALMSSPVTSLTLPSSVEKLGEGSLAASAITTITIPASVTTLGDDVFSGCKSLNAIVVPSTVRLIGTGVFKDCVSLASVELQSQMAEIPASMFEGCTALKSIAVPATVEAFGASAFANCSKLDQLNFPLGLTSIGSKAFYGTDFEDVDLAECSKLLAIGDYAFAKCGHLATFGMAPGVKVLGRGIFFDDYSLAQTTMPHDVDVIPAFTFKGARSITHPDNLVKNAKEIGDYALTGLSSVSEIKLPATLEHIGTSAMSEWSSLKEIDASQLDAVPTLGDFVWDNVDKENVILYVDSVVHDLFQEAPQWNEFLIKNKKTDSVDELLAEAGGDIEFRISGSTVRITSSGAPIVEVLVYDLAGRRCISESASAQVVDIDVNNLKAEAFVVYAVLADGTRSAVKFIF